MDENNNETTSEEWKHANRGTHPVFPQIRGNSRYIQAMSPCTGPKNSLDKCLWTRVAFVHIRHLEFTSVYNLVLFLHVLELVSVYDLALFLRTLEFTSVYAYDLILLLHIPELTSVVWSDIASAYLPLHTLEFISVYMTLYYVCTHGIQVYMTWHFFCVH